jgi:hypothetical protein
MWQSFSAADLRGIADAEKEGAVALQELKVIADGDQTF